MAATSITITDAGYRKANITNPITGPSGTGSESEKAKSGSAITIRVTSLTYNISALVSDESYKKYWDDDEDDVYLHGEVDHNGIAMPTWSAEGILDLSESADRTTMGNLCQCARTKGYKELTTDESDCMIKYSYETAVTKVYVRIKSITFVQSATSSKVKFTIEMVETT